MLNVHSMSHKQAESINTQLYSFKLSSDEKKELFGRLILIKTTHDTVYHN